MSSRIWTIHAVWVTVKTLSIYIYSHIQRTILNTLIMIQQIKWAWCITWGTVVSLDCTIFTMKISIITRNTCSCWSTFSIGIRTFTQASWVKQIRVRIFTFSTNAWTCRVTGSASGAAGNTCVYCRVVKISVFTLWNTYRILEFQVVWITHTWCTCRKCSCRTWSARVVTNWL